MLDNISNRCFICDLERHHFDMNANGFEQHILAEHHIWNYVYYIYHIQCIEATEHNGIESYVQSRILINDHTWFPNGQAIALLNSIKG